MTRIDNLIRFFKPDWRPQESIPPLDGALTPNSDLEHSAVVYDVPEAVDLCRSPDGLAIAAGNSLLVGDGRSELRTLAQFEARVCVVERSRDGGFLVGLQDRGVWRVSVTGERSVVAEAADGMAIGSPTSIAETEDGSVWITDGTTTSPTDDWAWDLFSKGASGRLIMVEPQAGEPQIVASQLRYPSGICVSRDGQQLLVSEAWAHTVWSYDLRRIALSRGEPADRTAVVSGLPGYPGRLRRRSIGGYWLTIFALRTQLTEFVLEQPRFRDEMMRTINPELWVRPAVRTLNTGLEPLQAGRMKKLGITKPWAPPRSYGLLVSMAEDGALERSWHSRAAGSHHGVTGVEDMEGGAFVVSSGSNRILRVVE